MKVNKLLYALIMFLFLQQVHAQVKNPGGHFTLNGKLTGIHVDTVYIRYQSDTGKYVYQANPVVNNEFIINGTINEPIEATISFKTNGGPVSNRSYWESTKIVYLEAGMLKLTGDASNPPDLKLSGSKAQAELDELDKKTYDIHEGISRVSNDFDRYAKEKNKAKLVELHAQYEAYAGREKDIDYKFFLSHPNSYVTVNKILSYAGILGFDSLKQVYNNYSNKIKSGHLGSKLALEIKKIQSGAGTPGSIAISFTTTDINGKPLSLSSFKGKYVMLDFWASWCVPCRKGNPHMIELYNKYKNKGFDVISVSDDGSNTAAWKSAVSQDKIGIWHHIRYGFRNTPPADDMAVKYGIRTLPTKILIDPDGKIIGRFGDNLGGTDDDMDKMLAAIFNK